jgi:N-acetylmuramoyl-L-alanine amidase
VINENADAIFVSIHLNKFTATSVNGAQVFYSPNNAKSRDLSLSIQNSIVKLLQNDNKRVVKKADSSTYLLKNATIPSVIVECGFVSNEKELSLLKDEIYQKKMAFAIFCGIEEYIMNEV